MRSPLPARLKAARTAAGFSQRHLGELLGMQPDLASSRITHYEKGRHAPDYSLVKKLSEVLNVPVPYFFTEDELMAELILELGKLDEESKISLIHQLKSGNIDK